MRDVVDLISSDNESPVRPSKNNAPNTSIAATRKSRIIVSHRPANADFDLTLDDEDDFPWDRKSKRRKHDTLPIIAPRVGLESRHKPQQNTLALGFKSKSSIPAAQAEDDIVFTSPARQKSHEPVWTTIDDQDEVNEHLPISNKWPGLSSRTTALLEEISANPSRRKNSKSTKNKAEDILDGETSSSSDDDSLQLGKDLTGKVVATEKAEQKAAKMAERERQRQEKASEKEVAKQARAEARIAKATEKQRAADLAAVNRSKMDKKVTTPEMIVDFPMSMEGTSSLTQCREFLRTANSQTTLYTSEIAGIIKFRRKIMADFDDELGYMVRVQPRTDDEKMILLYLPAEEFACLVSPYTAQDETLQGHLARVQSLHPGCRIMYLIEGLERLITREKNASNRAYQAAVRRAAAAAADKDSETATLTGSDDPPQPARKARSKNSVVIVDEAAIEAALLSLQIEHSVQIHQCISPLDIGETVLAMTQQLSLSRYRDPPSLTAAQMALQPNFCMSTGQVPTGKDLNDTYLKVLQQVIRVTEREARAIARVHPNLGALFAAFRSGGSKALEGIMKEGGGARGSAHGGPAAERRIGPATSERLYRIFLGHDSTEMIG